MYLRPLSFAQQLFFWCFLLFHSFLNIRRFIRLGLMLWLLGGNALAALPEIPLQRVEPQLTQQDLRPGAMRLADFTQGLSWEQALAQGAFISYQEFITKYPVDGTMRHRAWVLLQLENATSTPLERMLYLEDWVNHFILWVEEDGQWHQLVEQDYIYAKRFPSLITPFPHHPLTLPPGKQRILIEYDSYNPVLRELAVYEPAAFTAKIVQENFGYAMIVGVLLIMALYNLFLYSSFKTPEGLWFSVYIWMTVLFLLQRDRVIMSWFATAPWPDWLIHELAGIPPFTLGFLAQTLYSIYMLGLQPKKNYLLAGWLLFLAAVIQIGGVWMLVDYEPALIILNNVTAVLVVSILLLALVQSFRGVSTARWLAISIPPAVAGGILEMLSIQEGWKPIANPWQTGICLEVVLLSAYLSYRIRALRAAKEEADAQLLKAAQDQTAKLEAMVNEKTKELRYANQTKDKFFSIIAHDLRGPMGSLSIVFNQMMKSAKDLNEELFLHVRQSALNTYQLLEDLLTWARSQQGEIRVVPEDFDFYNICEATTALWEQAANNKGITLLLVSPAPVYVHADRSTATTALRNLISNAVKFTPNGGQVVVRVTPQGSEVLVEVQDNGVGIRPSLLQGLFQLDKKVASSPGTNQEKGSGLGLILCKEFVTRNGGQIGVESDMGKGSRFWFTLPLGVKPAQQPVEAWLKKLKSLKVLLVEDNPLHQQTSAKVLSDKGMQYLLASDGEMALELARQHSFDLILMDIDLPKLDGISATKAILKVMPHRPWVVALTSYSPKEVESRAGGLEFDGFLYKPLKEDEFLLAMYPLLEP